MLTVSLSLLFAAKATLEPCHHEVCSSCLVGMMGLFGARACPICRSPIVRYHQLPEPAAAASDKEVRVTQLFETHRYKYWILDISILGPNIS